MSIIPAGLGQQQNFYLSGPLPCPYLPARVERKLFTYLSGDPAADQALNAALTRAGFRRSHDILYRPACDGCQACIPVRLPVAAFAPSTSQRRIAARNRDLAFGPVDPADAALYPLFLAYQRQRHADGEMAQMSALELNQMLNSQIASCVYGLRDASGTLVAAILTDSVSDGASAVYSFFDPTQPQRSLGTQLVMSLLTDVAARGLAMSISATGSVRRGKWLIRRGFSRCRRWVRRAGTGSLR